jgi:hypothetical protein
MQGSPELAAGDAQNAPPTRLSISKRRKSIAASIDAGFCGLGKNRDAATPISHCFTPGKGGELKNTSSGAVDRRICPTAPTSLIAGPESSPSSNLHIPQRTTVGHRKEKGYHEWENLGDNH